MRGAARVFAHSSAGVLILCVVALPAVGAQSARAARPTPPARPVVRAMRFDESWPVRDSAWDSWADHLKHVPLGQPQVAWVTVAGTVRWRDEHVRNLLFSTAAPMRDAFTLLRAQLSADAHVESPRGPFARGFIEARSVRALDRTLPGGERPSDGDHGDRENAFLEFGWLRRGSVRVGRQDVVLGRERLVGLSDWSNARRAFEGVRPQFRVGAIAVDALDARVVEVRVRAANRRDPTARIRYLAAGSAAESASPRGVAPSSWQVYALGFDARGTAPHHRDTYGTRLEWKRPLAAPGGARLTLEGESAVQRGTLGARTISAWFATTEARLALTRVRTAPTLILGYDRASGNRADSARVVRSFVAHYATGHQYQGIADLFGRANLEERRVGFLSDLTPRAQLQWTYRRFARVEETDGVYSKANTRIFAGSVATDRAVGHEHDVTLIVRYGRHVRLDAGMSWVTAGAFMRAAVPGARVERFGFAGSAFTF